MHFFTSITTNYLPKARILAKSVNRYCPDSQFTLVIADKLPQDFNFDNEPFDQILFIDDLNIPVDNLKQWIFKHSVVELCTAIKGQAFCLLLEQASHDKVIYMDPDTVVFSNLSDLEKRLEEHSVVLTPHLTEPEKTTRGIMDNEVCALQHGTYNLGFLAIKNTTEGLKFARWWRDRLIDYCYDDIPNGLFTDQKWANLAPAFFDDIYIERNPGYNVATWNLSNRIIMKKGNEYHVNGYPLMFYHFSGFDSGAQEAMLNVYGSSNAAFELRKWYIEALKSEGQSTLGETPVVYDYFSNGETITKMHRYVMRTRQDVSESFKDKDPFIAESPNSYYEWFKGEIESIINLCPEEKDKYILDLEREIKHLKRFLRPLRPLKKVYNFLLKVR